MSQTSNKSSLASLFAVVIVDLIGLGIVLPILPFFAEQAGASSSQLGLLFTCYAAMQFVFAPIWGRLSDRIGRRPVILITVAGTALSLATLGFAQTLPWLFVARLLGGFFGANISVASAYITDATDSEERARYMGLLGASFALGFILGPVIGGALASYGYHVPFLFAAGLAGVNLVVAFLRLEELPVQAKAEDESDGGFRGGLSPEVLRFCAAYFIFVFGVSQLETMFAFFMLDRFQWEAHQVAFILAMMGVLSALIQGGAIRPLVRWFGEKKLLLIGCTLLAPSLASVPFAPTVALLLIPLAIASMARGLVHPALLSRVSSAAPVGERGGVMGTFQSSASLARVFGPVTAGFLYDQNFAWPFWLAGALMLLVLSLAAGVRPLEAPAS
ncbi:MAG: MFS transporter [Acidobacteriota bacterium]